MGTSLSNTSGSSEGELGRGVEGEDLGDNNVGGVNGDDAASIEVRRRESDIYESLGERHQQRTGHNAMRTATKRAAKDSGIDGAKVTVAEEGASVNVELLDHAAAANSDGTSIVAVSKTMMDRREDKRSSTASDNQGLDLESADSNVAALNLHLTLQRHHVNANRK